MTSVAELLIGEFLVPLNEEEEDLSHYELTKGEKLWVVNEILCQRSKPKLMNQKYKIPSTSINKWIRKVRQGKFFSDRVGRPRLLDDRSMSNVGNYCSQTWGLCDPVPTVLKPVIRNESHQTLSRRYQRVYLERLQQNNLPEMSRRSTGRYVDHYLGVCPLGQVKERRIRDVIIEFDDGNEEEDS